MNIFTNLFLYRTLQFIVMCTGLQDSDDEDLENDIDQQIESIMAPKRIVKEIKAPALAGAGVPGKYNLHIFHQYL